MSAVTEQRTPIQAALADFQSLSLKDAAKKLLDTLGYRSDRSLHFGNPPLYEKEVQDALTLIKQLETILVP